MEENFTLDGWPDPPPVVYLPTGLSKEDVLAFRAFSEWAKSLKRSLAQQKHSDHAYHKAPYFVKSIKIQAFDYVRGRIKYMKLFATVENDLGEFLPGIVFLRGGTVAILMILRPSDSPDERWVIMTEQARVAAGSLSFMEIPAGMIDDEQDMPGAAAKEVQEEVGIKVESSELINMTKLAVQGHEVSEALHNAMYPSPGACDEFMNIFLWEKEMDRLEIENMKDKLDGKLVPKKKMTLRLLNYEELLEVGGRDGKTLAAWSLYEYLKRTKAIP